jgi:hypothetical protein
MRALGIVTDLHKTGRGIFTLTGLERTRPAAKGKGEHTHDRFTPGNCGNKPRGGCERNTKVVVENLSSSWPIKREHMKSDGLIRSGAANGR